MKKVIPKKVANKVYDKFLSGEKNLTLGDWVDETLYKPGTNKIHNRFFKNSFTIFTYTEKRSSRKRNARKLHSTKKRLISKQQEINDYLQEK